MAMSSNQTPPQLPSLLKNRTLHTQPKTSKHNDKQYRTPHLPPSPNPRPSGGHNLPSRNYTLGEIPIHLLQRNRTQIPTLRIERSIKLQIFRIELRKGTIEDDTCGIRTLG